MKLNVGIIGATGMVGQRFIQGLENHPWFQVTSLMASSRSAGKKYREAAKWYLSEDIPEDIAGMTVEEIDPKVADEKGLDIIFSAIPSSVAREVEAAFAKKVPLFSNTATYRMDDDVPVLVPEVNANHYDILAKQKEKRGWDGFVVTNPNCSTAGLVIPLKPVMDEYGIESVNVTTMQALSGAGYDGVPSMAILDNMVPYIGGEEEKMEIESKKILGGLAGDGFDYAGFEVYATCNRVAVLNGHMESVLVKTERDFDLDSVTEVFRNFSAEPQEMDLPTAPTQAIHVCEADDRPQPRFDRMRGKGMTVSVGRIAKKNVNLLRFTCLSHNTIRGAAGGSILNAELAYKKNILKK